MLQWRFKQQAVGGRGLRGMGKRRRNKGRETWRERESKKVGGEPLWKGESSMS